MISAVWGTFCILALKQTLQHNPVFSGVNPTVNREPLFCQTTSLGHDQLIWWKAHSFAKLVAKAPQQKNKNVGNELNKMQSILQTSNQGILEPTLLQKSTLSVRICFSNNDTL